MKNSSILLVNATLEFELLKSGIHGYMPVLKLKLSALPSSVNEYKLVYHLAAPSIQACIEKTCSPLLVSYQSMVRDLPQEVSSLCLSCSQCSPQGGGISVA